MEPMVYGIQKLKLAGPVRKLRLREIWVRRRVLGRGFKVQVGALLWGV